MPEAYERLIMDVIRGNQTLFMRGDEVEAAWEWTDPIIQAWEEFGLAAAALRPGQRRADRRLQAHRRRRAPLARDRRMIEVARQAYPDRDTLMRDLAELVADQLRAAHAGKGRATLAVPGRHDAGAVPRRAVAGGPRLGGHPGDADRRADGVGDERALERAADPRDAAQERGGGGAFRRRCTSAPRARGAARVAAALPIDVLVLGMGADMHTASLFPGAPELAAALAEDAPELIEIHPPGQPEARLTLTAPVLRGGRGHPHPDHRRRQARGAGAGARGRAGRRGAGAGGADRALRRSPCTMPSKGR